MHKLLVFVFVLAGAASAIVAGCAPYKPVPDSGTPPQDAAPKEAAACVGSFEACTVASVCCDPTFICNNSGLCQKACLGIGNVCTVNADCCTGICNGTCE